ncbi:alpha/beta fold hydrolase [uncultured Ruminococcus sp.]|uniref:alpha/beta hydrolase family protein n=1 Tax=uncultured Ruminococcus sp. TaxID=165186 RepID=UPI002930BFF4|nr:alpha/beta fold hydrolase [uncultured Ruminococcus sp.]
MKRWMVMIVCLLLAVLFAGCSHSAGTNPQTNEKPSETTEEKGIGESTVQTGSYTTQEIKCPNSTYQIYGIAYIPNDGKEKHPLIIFSHELGNSHTSGVGYAERLSQIGYAVYVFDFYGGTVGGNQTGGNNTEMSVMTEVSDLEAVLKTAKTWDFVDTDNIILMGGSQGGAVTALTGVRHQDEIEGMILLYPALSLFSDIHERFSDLDSVPEQYDMFGGWITVGKKYAADVWDIDPYQELSRYQGKVLLLHGDKDNSVDISYSDRLSKVLPNVEYHVISGGGHEFFGQPFEDAVTYITSWLESNK